VSGDHDNLYFYLGESKIGCMDYLASNYSVEVVIDNGSCMYLNTEKIDNNIKIFPNPVIEQIFIELNYSYELQEILIYDVNHKVVYQKTKSSDKKHEINISKLDSGVYFVSIITENEKIIKKIVKE